MIKHKLIATTIMTLIILVNMINIALAATTEVVIDDTENDQMYFEYDWLSEMEDVDDWDYSTIADNLDTVFETLQDEWDTDDEDIGHAVETPDFGDIDTVTVSNLDESTATLKVEFFDSLEDVDDIWMFFIWSNCSSDDWTIIIFYFPDSMGGDGNAYYEVLYGDNDTGTADVSGSSFEVDFDSSAYEEKSNCAIRCMMFVFDYSGSEINGVTADLAPNDEQTLLEWFWQWLWLFILIAILAILGIVYYNYRKDHPKIKGDKK